MFLREVGTPGSVMWFEELEGNGGSNVSKNQGRRHSTLFCGCGTFKDYLNMCVTHEQLSGMF